MVAKMISELKSVSRPKILAETGPRCFYIELAVFQSAKF